MELMFEKRDKGEGRILGAAEFQHVAPSLCPLLLGAVGRLAANLW
jgi:hypothetical protein